jgi:hypothetical protein
MFAYSREAVLTKFEHRGVPLPDKNTLPDWVLSLLLLLTSEGLYDVPVWRDVLTLWLQLEQLNGYAVGTNLIDIPDLYPATALGWFNSRRSISWRPRCDNYGSFELQTIAAGQYWRYLQPSWRVNGEGFVGGEVGDFSALSMPGLDGWPNVLVAFFFAAGDFGAEGGAEISEGWLIHVNDIKVAMGGLLAQSVTTTAT